MNQASRGPTVQRWVIDFGLLIGNIKRRYGYEIPDLENAQLCDWFRERLFDEFPRYASIHPVEDERDGESYVIRVVAESPYEPRFRSRYFNLVLVRRYEEVYRSDVR